MRYQGDSRRAHKVKWHSPRMRFVIALHSPSAVAETGLPTRSPEKLRRRSLHSGCGQPFSPVRFERKSSGNAAVFSHSQSNAARILDIPDCVAERQGFEPWVPFC